MDVLALTTRFSNVVLAPKSDDDFSDRLSYRYTAGLLIFFSIIILTRQYGSVTNIKCWLPAHFTNNYDEYITQICWMTNTYKVGPNDHIWKDEKSKKNNEITYYQWVVFLLLLQALLFYAPRIAWKKLSSCSGMNLTDLIEAAYNYKHIKNIDNQASYMRYMVSNIHQFVDNERRYKQKRPNIYQRLVLMIFPFTGKYLGNYLVILYFTTKMLYVANTYLQGLLISSVLGQNYFKFGYELYSGFKKGDGFKNIESVYFPRTTYCDFYVREVGNPLKQHRYTVQCVLPINLFNQQIFTVIWCWLLFVQFCNIVEIMKWGVRMIPLKCNDWIKRRVRLYAQDFDAVRDAKKLEHFVDPYLESDGMFMIRMIANNCGDQTASDLVTELWKKHTEVWGDSFDSTEQTE